jgi:glycosyltransferase involved in cell wall biosynthesis
MSIQLKTMRGRISVDWKIKLFLFVPIIFFASILGNNQTKMGKKANLNVKINDPLLVVVLMVKNEEDVIVPTLKPFVDGGVDAFYIFDTGSTDKTVEVVTEYLQKSGVRFAVGQEPFIDFAASRNRGLDLALEVFPHSAYMVMPDAEWYIHNSQDLIKFCKDNLNDMEPAYSLHIASEDLDFYTPRLIRTSMGSRFVGKVHEVLDHPAQKKVPGHVIFELRPSRYGAEKSRKRWERDAEILMRGYLEDPFGTRNLFYLAQTHWCLGNLEEAYRFYKIRAPLTGWDEEDYLSWYRLGLITEELAKHEESDNLPLPHAALFADIAKSFKTEGFENAFVMEQGVDSSPKRTWSEAMGYFLKAFTMRPRRAEPIIHIALHYLNDDNHEVGYIFALRAAQIPYPENDILMVEKDLYDFFRWEILSRCAWYVGEVELGFTAACKAKRQKPELAHVQRNAQLFFDRLCESEVAS